MTITIISEQEPHMKGKASLVLGIAAGYVLGTRDGRERYEQITSQVNRLWNDPTVQRNVSQAQHVVKEKAPQVQAKVSDAAHKATSKVSGSGDSSSSSSVGSSTGPTTVDTAVVPPSPSVTSASATVPDDSKGSGDWNG
jgi:hypothetical protein